MEKPKRTLVVGDIHGAYKALLQILNRSNFNIDEDKIIFLGDYIDGWPHSSEVVQKLIELKTLCKHEPIFIKGNHDYWAVDYLKGKKILIEDSTLISYEKTGYKDDPEHLKFFKDLKNYYIDEENRAFVHAGFNSDKGLGNEKDVEITAYFWDRDMWKLAITLDGTNNKSPGFYKHKEVFVGHTSTIFYECNEKTKEYKSQGSKGLTTVPMNRCNVWNIDTGVKYRGKLTIMNVDTKEFWQSDTIEEIYNPEVNLIPE